MTTPLNANTTDPNATLKPFFRVIFHRFIFIYTLSAVLLSLLLFHISQQYSENLESSLLAQEESFVASTVLVMQKEMKTQLMIMQMTSRSKLLSNFIENKNKTDKQRLETLFYNLSSTFQCFEQLTLLDEKGNERMRVNYKNSASTLVSKDDLKSKQDANYFQNGINQPAGKVHVSPMGLNMNTNVLQNEYDPIMFFSTPIKNETNETIGVFVANYLATGLLQSFRNQMTLHTKGQGMLIDPQGYWISDQNKANEWGANLGNKNQKFEQLYPIAWAAIENGKDGVIKTPKGLFRYIEIAPFGENIKNHQSKETDFSVTLDSKIKNNWKLVVFLPNEVIYNNSFFHQPSGQAAIAFLFVILGIIILLWLILAEEKKRLYDYDLFIKNELIDLYENSPCGYHSLDKNGLIIKMNQTELNWLGRSKEDVLGKSFADFLAAESKKTFQTFLEDIQISKKVEGVILEVECSQGHSFYLSTSATSVIEDGAFIVAHTSVFDISDRIKLEKRLAYIANTDVLTEINSRRHFFTLADKIFETENELSLMMLDIDHFKNVNDQYGHNAGDSVLKSLPSILLQTLPKEAILGRLGGEEFAILLSGVDPQATLSIADQLCKDISNTPIDVNGSSPIKVTASIGIAQRTEEVNSISDLLKHADIALYEAKSTGRNKAV